jgi:D-amino-acid dehydrogenase
MTDNCSYGNLGMIVPSHFVPLAAPGIVLQGLKWMFDSSSPFYVKPSLDPALWSWGVKFAQSATRSHVAFAAPFLRDLSLYSKALYEALPFSADLTHRGILMYFKTPRTGEEEIHLAEKARGLGLDAVALSPSEIRVLEPGLALDVLGAVHYRCDAHLTPHKLMGQLLSTLRSRGVEFVTESPVVGIDRVAGRVVSVRTSSGSFSADRFVLAGGSWLPSLARMAGVSIPLMPGKGYSFTAAGPILNVPAILCEARVAITPMGGAMRYGGTMEIASVNDRVRMNRVRAIVGAVPRYFPGIRLPMPAEKDVWYGFRPCSPDGLPYIGPARGLENLLIAGGHSMMGLSLGPATGKVIADMASGLTPEVRVEAFRADRFS